LPTSRTGDRSRSAPLPVYPAADRFPCRLTPLKVDSPSRSTPHGSSSRVRGLIGRSSCGWQPGTGTSRARTAGTAGSSRGRGSASATCGASRSTPGIRRSSWCRGRAGPARPTWQAAPTAGFTARGGGVLGAGGRGMARSPLDDRAPPAPGARSGRAVGRGRARRAPER